jgi:hypothetical protein
MGDGFAATTSPQKDDASLSEEKGGETGAAEPAVVAMRELGAALERIVRLADGTLVAVVADGARVPAEACAMAILPASAASALAALGEASPLARAEAIYEKGVTAGSQPATAPWRMAALAAALRKLEAARVLRSAGQASEALPLLHASLVLLCRAAASDDPGDDPAPLLAAVYGDLMPRGVITSGDAHALSRAAELNRAFASSPVPASAALVEPLLRDTADLAARLETRLYGSGTGQEIAVTRGGAGFISGERRYEA